MKCYRLEMEDSIREEKSERNAVTKLDRRFNGRIVGFEKRVLARVLREREKKERIEIWRVEMSRGKRGEENATRIC